MAQVINTNVQSLNAQRNLNNSAQSLATSLQRLSSGLRINSAKDDAAGLAISERFSTQIRGLNIAVRNANDGISLSQTAEGALGEISNNLQRIRELSVQARNATNSASDRAALNAEVQQRLAEIERTASQTSFNGQKILDGTFGKATFQVGSNAGEVISLNLDSSSRANNIGKIAEAVSTALGATATGGNNTIAPTSLLFGTAGTADGSLGIEASNRLFGPSGVSATQTLAPANANFTTATQAGSNTQTLTPAGGTIDLSGPGALAQFDVSDGALNVGITLNANYANGGAIAAAINSQLGATASTVSAAYDGASNTIKFTNSAANLNTAVVISGADANSVNTLGVVNSTGTAGGTVGAQFNIDGNAITLSTDLSASAAAFAGGIQTALNTAAPGTYTVELSGNNIDIRNNNAGSGPVVIAGANDIAVAAGITNSTGTQAANPATAGSFVVENGVTDITVNLNANYADFDALAAAVQGQLDTAAANTFTVTNTGASISIARDAGGVVEINSSNARAAAAGFGPAAGVVTTNASFDVDGSTVTLAQDYGSLALLAADIESQLTGYTVAAIDTDNDTIDDSISITNDTLGSTGVVIANADANAQAAGIADSAGTAGIGAGTITLASGGLTVLDGTGKTSTFSGTYDNLQALANDINSNANGVFASATTDGKLQLQSAQAFTVGGSDAAAFGFGSAEVATTDGSLNDVNVLTTAAADEAIVRIDAALQSVSSLRSDFGAVQNRFESTISNLQITSENLAASRSRILDADFAAETANLTRAQILQQAGVAILAQANQLPQNVLSLLR